MERRRSIAVVDSNFRRRAAMSHSLAGSAIHVEPFETIDELAASWPRTEAIMVEDRHEAIEELIGLMTERGRWLPLIAFAEEPSIERIVRAVLAGAVDYLHWPCEPAQVLGALIGAESAGHSLGMIKLREAQARSRVRCLTRREREVLAGVAEGKSNRLIGQQLEISPRTVEIHRANMLTKMGAKHTSEAIRIAIEASLLA
ncbi:LuxR C-terminal-related transcriptional regulator [Novosphingobium sp.]|uniref:response regulator transcription factor n=1 Tax=Novosphingobium sp. TaxID=1874826 RepID=UPI0022C7CD1A|nr:LuxR C-terminal-related transcriptional regulator [Novosphingobium sp.]MCZ8018035.1 LuxR C-terminal-related transcriptional regulator [Novosphingobium sp.]MCZ8034354.1 LuxR C-terminal-related transcriptional regulator [Novosphingobium sp.]MCZ8052322.1 LuxR C-terminal-related transcriptional regulator [Novosphingobium sp.]MCZ8061187.1 LuxR C-terminal-related transcriptional regulator [Novosphingobium sp.]MCZ8232818.1 LuxR C-terminal-related transcriptional regulator [Novosphingobium sp.]